METHPSPPSIRPSPTSLFSRMYNMNWWLWGCEQVVMIARRAGTHKHTHTHTRTQTGEQDSAMQ